MTDKARFKGVSLCEATAVSLAGCGSLVVGFCHIMTQRFALHGVAGQAGFGVLAIRVNPSVAQGVAFCEIANLAMLGCFAGSINPCVVAEDIFVFHGSAELAGLGCLTGCVRPVMVATSSSPLVASHSLQVMGA